jgi:isopenicillin N synthase-like dioxygenase
MWKAIGEVGIPVIDLSSLRDPVNPSESVKTTKAIAEACRDYGFFYVKHHGVSELVQNNLLIALKKFFALPFEKKEKIKTESTQGMVGYFNSLSSRRHS